MSTIILRGGVEIGNARELVLGFLEAYAGYEARDSSGPASFDERDLRLANRGGARISAAETAAILARRVEIERALRRIDPDASLADAASSVPWAPLTQLFEAFADIRGVGFSKMTKTLHRKRPALIPILDSVVQASLPSSACATPRRSSTRTTYLQGSTSTSTSTAPSLSGLTLPTHVDHMRRLQAAPKARDEAGLSGVTSLSSSRRACPGQSGRLG